VALIRGTGRPGRHPTDGPRCARCARPRRVRHFRDLACAASTVSNGCWSGEPR